MGEATKAPEAGVNEVSDVDKGSGSDRGGGESQVLCRVRNLCFGTESLCARVLFEWRSLVKGCCFEVLLLLFSRLEPTQTTTTSSSSFLALDVVEQNKTIVTVLL